MDTAACIVGNTNLKSKQVEVSMVYLASPEVIAPVERAKGRERDRCQRTVYISLPHYSVLISPLYALEKGKLDRDFILLLYVIRKVRSPHSPFRTNCFRLSPLSANRSHAALVEAKSVPLGIQKQSQDFRGFHDVYFSYRL